MISGYNEKAAPVTNLFNIISRGLKIYGFIVFWLHHKYLENFYKEIPKKIAAGEFKYIEDVTEGLDKAGHALLAVQKGLNKGKSVIIVARE